MNKDARVSIRDACHALEDVERDLNGSLSGIQDQNMKNKLREQLTLIRKINKDCEQIALGISNHG